MPRGHVESPCMNILIVSYFFPPINSIASLRALSFAKAFTRLDHNVTVITAAKPPNKNDLTADHQGYRVIEVRSRCLDWFCRLLQINADRPSNDSQHKRNPFLSALRRWCIDRGLPIFRRMPDLCDLLIQPTRTELGDRQWDLVISTYAPRYCHAVAYTIKKSRNATFWVADFRDLWTQNHLAKGLFPFTHYERWLERKYLTTADLVTTVSEDLAQEVRTANPNTAVRVITNGFDRADLAALPADPIFTGNYIRLVYTGTIYPRWDSFTLFIDTLRDLKSQMVGLSGKLRVLFLGQDLARLSDYAAKQGVDDVVEFLGQKPRTTALRMQRDAHVQLLFEPNHGSGIATGKLYEYISSGSLVWLIGFEAETAASRVITKTRTGVCIQASRSAISTALNELLAAQTKPVPGTNPSVIAQFDRYVIAKTLLDHVDALKSS